MKHHPEDGLVLHGVPITHPDRVVYAEGRITKGQVAQYYAAVAPFLLRDITGRPISLLRCPSGIKADCFYQRNVGAGLGGHVHPFAWDYKGRSYQYIYVTDETGIMQMVQMGVIEIHPWGATVDRIHTPDRMIFDLDPDPTVPFSEVKRAAMEIRQRLAKTGLVSFLKCTGGKGLHIVVPLSPTRTWDEVKGWARNFAHEMVEEAPDRFVATMTKAKRAGKIFIDYFRNDYTATGIAAYSLRARPGAPVAMPLQWRDLAKLEGADQFDMAAVMKRIARQRRHRPLPRQRLPEWKSERLETHGRKQTSSHGSLAG